jgi:hypothetical protein
MLKEELKEATRDWSEIMDGQSQYQPFATYEQNAPSLEELVENSDLEPAKATSHALDPQMLSTTIEEKRVNNRSRNTNKSDLSIPEIAKSVSQNVKVIALDNISPNYKPRKSCRMRKFCDMEDIDSCL